MSVADGGGMEVLALWSIERLSRSDDPVTAGAICEVPGVLQCILVNQVVAAVEVNSGDRIIEYGIAQYGDIGAGAVTLGQLITRPTASLYRTPLKKVYLRSASTPPAPGVHGMCGYFAAEMALREVR